MKNYIKVFIIGIKYIVYLFNNNSLADNMLIMGVILLYGGIYEKQVKARELESYKSYCVGVVTKIKPSMHGNDGITYAYICDEKTYSGYVGIEPNNSIRIGDSLIIAYAYTNPKNSKYVCFFEPRLDKNRLPDSVYYRQRINENRVALDFPLPKVN